MYSRIHIPITQSTFLFGPRGTGKSTYLHHHFPHSPYIDLLDDEIYTALLADPKKISVYIPSQCADFIIVDEIQKLPKLLDEVHRLIENKKYRFILTGSSARKLRRSEVNLLGGRALTEKMFPLTVAELGEDFDLVHSLQFGHLPMAYTSAAPAKYLASFVKTFLEEEVKQEGLTRNLGAFSRFLQAASFSQAGLLSISDVARECSVERKVVENYFIILEDLLLAYRIPVFAKKAKRRLVQHAKFFYFDVGIYQAIRPKGPLDTPENIEGAALETLVFQEIAAMNSLLNLGYEIYFWRTSHKIEVDFVLYGPKGLVAVEIKRSRKFDHRDLSGLKAFLKDYPMAKAFFVYGGEQKQYAEGIEVWPVIDFLKQLQPILSAG